MTNAAPPAPIVVGADGSPASGPALRFALQEAQLRGTGLRAVCAYDFTTRYSGLEWFAASGFHDLDTQLRDSTLEAVTKAVEEARGQVGGEPVEVDIRVEPGRPSQVLLDASADACLLVVGSRGSGAWGRLTLGSTSTEVVHNAHLPVVVVPGGQPDRTS
ncbi:universal stress protein [Streptomyces virginiae]|uniref:universal stress protein n=1 Tax=Streptomyces TaxID=1883 RepID=UPI000524B0D1|nr:MULTISPECIES: universal stress protein [Streptomyces]MCX4718226.1 universal stress protein [Streptomyces virginiae]WSX97068.1 universal stress protein [Streptomyces goshikiensis]